MSADVNDMREQNPPAARSFPCARCGAALAPTSGTITCGHCKLAQEAPAGWVSELETYGDAVARTNAAIERHNAEAAVATGTFGTGNEAGGSLLARNIPLVVGIPLGLAALAIIVGVVLLVGPLTSAWVLRALLLVPMAWLFWWSRRRPSRIIHATRLLACGRCGAPSEVEVAPSSASCKHCGAPLSAPPAVMAEVLTSAQFELQDAAIAHLRVARRATAGAYEVERSRMPFAASVVGFLAVGSSVLAGWYLVAGSALLGAAALVVALRRFDAEKRERFAAAVASLGAELGGRPIRSVSDQVAWLNAYWFAEYAPANFDRSRAYAGLWLERNGFPVLIEVDLKRFRRTPFTSDFGQRIDIFVAAELPDSVATRAEAVVRIERLRVAGFRRRVDGVGRSRIRRREVDRSLPRGTGIAA